MTHRPLVSAALLIVASIGVVCDSKPSDAAPAATTERHDAPTQDPMRPLVEEIRPYVLELGSDHATLCWMTTKAVAGEVTLFDYDSEKRYTEDGQAGYMHKVRMDGLTPGTTYRYQIGRNHQGTFRTADSTPSFEVAVFGHPGGTEQPLEYPTELLQGRLIALAPEFAMCTGDITLNATMRGMRDTFLRRFDQYMASRPIQIAPSNHEGKWNGHSYDVFRTLFPYDFALPTGGTHTFDYKHARFFALTYKLRTPELFAEHVTWLAEQIDASDKEFNIVFLGGQEPKYYDKKLLFETLAARNVELVLGGDGGGVFQENVHGQDFFFCGDGGLNAYPFYYLRFHAHHFDVQLQYSDGTRPSKNLRTFYSKKKRKVLTDLAPHAIDGPSHLLQFKGIGVKSTEIDGLHLTFDWPHDEPVELQMLIKPKKGGRSKEQCHLIPANSKTEVLIDIPEWSPTELAGTTYVLDELTLQLARHRPYHKKYDVQKAISNAYLFAR